MSKQHKVVTPHKPVTWFLLGGILLAMFAVPGFSILRDSDGNSQEDWVTKVIFGTLGLCALMFGFLRSVTSVTFSEEGVSLNKVFGSRLLPWDQIRSISFDDVNFRLGHHAQIMAGQQIAEKWMIIVTTEEKQITVDAQRGKALKAALTMYEHKLPREESV